MTIGSLRGIAIDVNDLDVGERFWSALTGLAVTLPAWNQQYLRLGHVGAESILLQLVPEPKQAPKNRVHLDVTVDDVDRAVEEVRRLGGRLVSGPTPYPDSGTPARMYAVMVDPFDNEFCLVRELMPDSAVMSAASETSLAE